MIKRRERWNQRALVLSLVCLLPFLIAAWNFGLIDASPAPTCVFRAVTGSECVFCGLSRSFVFAAQGDFEAAFAFHRAWPFFVGALLLVNAISAYRVFFVTAKLDQTVGTVWSKGGWVFLLLLVAASFLW